MTSEQQETAAALPLAGIRVLEFGHTIMGPSCGLILADLGADVIKIEPPDGDRTRRLKGFGTGYFGFFNRNKRSLAVDLKSAPGKAALHRLIAASDVLIENFAPGTLERQGYGYAAVSALNPRLIYCSLKGFLGGPYQHRAALDEVVQMMGGLAFMTGPSGRPLRAGTSVVDITGGSYGAFGIVLALGQRKQDGRGRLVESSLFESTAFLMGQHLAYAAQSDAPIPPMPERVSAWAVYEIFDTADGEKLFVGITSDPQWERFCQVFVLPDLAADATLKTNNARIEARPRLIPRIAAIFRALPLSRAAALAEEAAIAFAPIARPEDLFDDPHLNANGSLMATVLPGGIHTKLPQLPLRIDGSGFLLRCDPPAIGEHSREVLAGVGYSPAEIGEMIANKIVTAGGTDAP